MERSGNAQAPDAREAFGKTPQKAGWSPGHRIFIAVLLACVCLGLIRLNAIKQRESCLNLPPTPALASLPARELSALRANLAGVMSRADGRVYASGSISPRVVWTDNPPVSGSLELSGDNLEPASDEIREWAPDPRYGAAYPDDIAGDVFMFASPSQARLFFERATALHCHLSGTVQPAPRPPQARNLVWVNPDAVTEQDVFLLRGRLVYRIVDVRPGSHEAQRSSAARGVALASVDRLACTIAGADCPRMSPARLFSEQANDAVCALAGELVSENRESAPFVLFPIFPRTRAIVTRSVQQLSAIAAPPAQAAAYASFLVDLRHLLALGQQANVARAAHNAALVNHLYYERAPAYQAEFVSLQSTLGLKECTPVVAE
jgi:hypothetical protein